MKRFWTSAEAVRTGGGWGITLDGKPLRTPARASLVLPTDSLARAIAQEWDQVQSRLDPREMPLTGLANAAIDRVEPDRLQFADALAKYAEGELACYRAETPRELASRQAEEWDALLSWARRRFDVDFTVTCGLLHVAQPGGTVEQLTHAVTALDAFRLAALSPMVTIGGSLVAALAVLEGAFTAEQAWQAVTVDERWQLDQWGSDAEAEKALENRRHDFSAAARFLKLLD